MKNFIKILLLLIVTQILFSCSKLFLRKHMIIHSSKDSDVYFEGKKLGTANEKIRNKSYTYNTEYKSSGKPQAKEYEVTKDRHKIRTEVIYPTKLNGGMLTSLIFFAYGPLIELEGYHRNFEKNWNFPLTPYPDLENAHHHIAFEDIKLDDSLKAPFYFTRKVNRYKKGKENIFKKTKEEYEVKKSKNGDFKKRLNLFLKDIGTYNQDHIDLSNYQEYSIYADIQSMKVSKINFYRSETDILKLNVTTQFVVLNTQGDTVISKSINSTSGHFRENKWDVEYHMLVDALDYATIELLNNPKLFKLLKNKETSDTHHTATQHVSPANKSLVIRDIYNDYFTLNAGSDSLKSVCFPVGKDGILLASSLALDHSNENIVYSKDSIKYKFTVIKEIPGQEVALIKIDTIFNSTFNIAPKKDIHIGDAKVYVAGFESYFNELLITQGVIGAKREYEENPYYQIDASCQNQIQPFVFNADGAIIGIVTRSLLSGSVEGISFCSILD